MEEKKIPYLWVEFVDFFNRRLDITRMDGGPDLYSFLDRFHICLRLDVGLQRKFLRCGWVAVGDEVIHD